MLPYCQSLTLRGLLSRRDIMLELDLSLLQTTYCYISPAHSWWENVCLFLSATSCQCLSLLFCHSSSFFLPVFALSPLSKPVVMTRAITSPSLSMLSMGIRYVAPLVITSRNSSYSSNSHILLPPSPHHSCVSFSCLQGSSVFHWSPLKRRPSEITFWTLVTWRYF